MIRMDELNKIRKAFYAEGFSVNEISKKFKRSWSTINTIIKTPRDVLENPDRKERNREPTVGTQEVIDAINDYLDKEVLFSAKRKQRYRSNVIFKELRGNGIYKGSKRRLQELVKEARRNRGQIEPKSFLPLEFELGSALQVDHGEVDCIISDCRMMCYLFVGSIPGTTLRYCQLFGTKAQEAWGEFHERCFSFFKGIFLRVIYDNDSVLIKDCSKGQHVETSFSLALCEHYGFAAVYCNPASGNEKGSVENAVGFCRRNYLPGCSIHESFDIVNQYLEQQCLNEIANAAPARNGDSAQAILAKVKINLKPLLPVRKWVQRDSRLVHRYQMVEVYDHFYSVPENFIGKYVRVAISAFKITIHSKDELIYEHVRIFAKGVDSLVLDHYLDQLRKKPGALWDCKATKGLLNDIALESIWERLLERHPFRKAQKDFIDILYLRKKYEENHWQAGINKALDCGAYDPTAIESIIKMLLTPSSKCNEIATQEQFLSRNLNVPKWECKLAGYGTLSKETALKETSYPKDKIVPMFHNTEFSKHGNAMQGKWNGTIADHIMDEDIIRKAGAHMTNNEEKILEEFVSPEFISKSKITK